MKWQTSLRTRWLWLGLLLVAPSIVRAERLPIKTYTTAEGLPHDSIMRIVRDSRGFLWFCTEDGLSRFDGYQFTNYGVQDGLSHSRINDLLETRTGDYWVATNGGGVCRFKDRSSSVARRQLSFSQNNQRTTDNGRLTTEQSRFTVYRVGEHAWTNRVNALYEDSRGVIWAGTDEGVFSLDQPDGQFRFVELPLERPLGNGWTFVEDRAGNLWIGTWAGLVQRRPNGEMVSFVFDSKPGRSEIRALLVDREGRLWVGTRWLGVMVLDPARLRIADFRLRNETMDQSAIERYTTADGLTGNLVGSLYQAADGRIYIGTSGGLTVFDGQRFQKYTTDQGLLPTSADTANMVAEDRDGNLWLGTSTGALKITWNGFTSYSQADGLAHASARSIFQPRSGELCVIAGDMIIHRFDSRRFMAIRPNFSTSPSYFGWGTQQIVLQDRTGEWWIATGDGLYRFPKVARIEDLARTQPKKIYTTATGLPGNNILRLFEDSRGDLWVSMDLFTHTGLARWERAREKWQVYTWSEESPLLSAVTAFSEDRSGDVWVGFYDGGLMRIRNGRFERFTTADGVPAGGVRSLYLDQSGRLWVATNMGGLGQVDDPAAERPQFVTYTIADGLASNYLWSITEDQWGRIYVGTGRGLDRLDPATGRVKHFTTADGLTSNDVTLAFRDQQGALWFGSAKGVSRYVPAPDKPAIPPSILISGLRIRGVLQPISELGETVVSGLEMRSNQNQVQIDFVGLSFGSGESLRYQYRLDGADADWNPVTNQRTVNYANLASGTYRFLVRALSADGAVSTMPATVSFTILPPVWQRWWFLMLVGIAAASVVLTIYRFRVTRLLEMERIRTRIAADLHDDIGSNLSRIALLSEVVHQQMPKGDREAGERLALISSISRESVDAMSDIVWAINPKRDRLRDLAQRMRRFAEDAFNARNIAYRFRAPGPEQDIKLGADMRREIFLIFKEAVNNMIRHSGCSEAEIDFQIEGGRLVLTMSDNGKGYDPTLAGDGHGLISMRERARKLDGDLEIDSCQSKGTTILLRVPAK